MVFTLCFYLCFSDVSTAHGFYDFVLFWGQPFSLKILITFHKIN